MLANYTHSNSSNKGHCSPALACRHPRRLRRRAATAPPSQRLIDAPLTHSQLALPAERGTIGRGGSGGWAQRRGRSRRCSSSRYLLVLQGAARRRLPAGWPLWRCLLARSEHSPVRRPRACFSPRRPSCLGGRLSSQNGWRPGRRLGPAEAVAEPTGLAGTGQGSAGRALRAPGARRGLRDCAPRHPAHRWVRSPSGPAGGNGPACCGGGRRKDDGPPGGVAALRGAEGKRMSPGAGGRRAQGVPAAWRLTWRKPARTEQGSGGGLGARVTPRGSGGGRGALVP